MIVAHGPSDAAGDGFVAGLDPGMPGVLIAPAIPGLTRFLPVIGDLMFRLGKVSPPSGYHPHDPDLAPIWLAAEPIDAVVVPHADLYPGPVLIQLDACCRAGGATLWALADEDRVASTARCAGEAVERVVGWDGFRSAWERRRQRVGRAARPDDPQLVLDTVWQAEHARLRTLSSRPSTDAYVNGFAEAAGWRNERRPSREAIAERLQGLLLRFDTASCRVRALRGAEVALRHLGWDLTIDLQRMAGGPAALDGPVRALNVSSLRQERLPDRAAAAALAAAELTMEEILGLSMDRVARDGSRVLLGRTEVPVPAGLRVFLRAQLLHRIGQGAGARDPFITADTARNPAGLIRVIVGTQEALSEPRVADELRTAPGAHERWLIDAGVHLRYTPARDRPSIAPSDLEQTRFREGLLDALTSVERPARCEVCRMHHEPPSPDPLCQHQVRRPLLINL